MTIYRRIEITAFRRRVLIVSGDLSGMADQADVTVNYTGSREIVETGSDEEREIMIEAVRLLEEKIAKHTRPRI